MQNSAPKLQVPLVIVTGGNGWLGRRVVLSLTRGLEATQAVTAGDHRVRCLVPENENVDFLRDLGADIVRGDIRDGEAMQALLEDAQGALLLHLAGIIHPRRVSEFDEVNTQGTIRLLELARQSQIRRLVAMSSNSPIGCNPYPEHRFTESSPFNPYMGYGRSKWRMELALKNAIAASGRPEVVILRAPWFYGPGQPPRQTLFFSMIKNGKFPIVGDGTNRRSMSYVDNLTSGILLAAAQPAAAGETYWIADEVPYSMQEIVDTVRSVLRDDFGMKVAKKSVRLPYVIGEVATLTDRLLQVLGIYQQKIHVLSEMNKTIACDIGKAKRELGYSPAIALREGMRRSVAWCLDQGHKI